MAIVNITDVVVHRGKSSMFKSTDPMAMILSYNIYNEQAYSHQVAYDMERDVIYQNDEKAGMSWNGQLIQQYIFDTSSLMQDYTANGDWVSKLAVVWENDIEKAAMPHNEFIVHLNGRKYILHAVYAEVCSYTISQSRTCPKRLHSWIRSQIYFRTPMLPLEPGVRTSYRPVRLWSPRTRASLSRASSDGFRSGHRRRCTPSLRLRRSSTSPAET